MSPPLRPPPSLFITCRRHHQAPTACLLVVSVLSQRLRVYRAQRKVATPCDRSTRPYRHLVPCDFALHRSYVISTSKFGHGQVQDSQKTPLGLHRVARKIGGGWPVGTVFKARQPVGFTWRGQPHATIAHRILWLEGLEPGWNRGGRVDSLRRFIYLHGLADEPTLGRPASHGCVHLASGHLIPLFDRLRIGTLVWITLEP